MTGAGGRGGGRLSGKRALVMAAGQGIGRAIHDAFVQEGAAVIGIDRDPKLVADLVNGLVLDLTIREQVVALAGRVEPVDILVNAAGMVQSGDLLACSMEDWDAAVALNMTAMFLVTKAILPGMRQRGGGSIINVASVASSIIGVPDRFAYGATKGAVIGMTKAIAADYVAENIRCNAICPGTVETPSLLSRVREQAERTGKSYDESYEAFAGRQPMRRLGQASEIAALAVHLASDESAFTTGTTAVIDGGWTLL